MYVCNIKIHIFIIIKICIKKCISGILLMCMNINIMIIRFITIFIHIFMCIKSIRTKSKQKNEL